MKKPKLLISGLAVMLLLSGCGAMHHVTNTGSHVNTRDKVFHLTNKKVFTKCGGVIGASRTKNPDVVYINTALNSNNPKSQARQGWKYLQADLKKKNYRPTDKIVVTSDKKNYSDNGKIIYHQIATGTTRGNKLDFNVSHNLVHIPNN